MSVVFYPEVFIRPLTNTHTRMHTRAVQRTRVHTCTPAHTDAHVVGPAPAAPTEVAAMTQHHRPRAPFEHSVLPLRPFPAAPRLTALHGGAACKVSAGLAARGARQGGSRLEGHHEASFPLGSRLWGPEQD